MNYSTFKSTLNKEKTNRLISHFDEIYSCTELSEHEFRIAFLAYLWKNDFVLNSSEFGYEILNETELGIDIYKDYEISFEAGEAGSGGINLGITYDYYNLSQLMEIV